MSNSNDNKNDKKISYGKRFITNFEYEEYNDRQFLKCPHCSYNTIKHFHSEIECLNPLDPPIKREFIRLTTCYSCGKKFKSKIKFISTIIEEE